MIRLINMRNLSIVLIAEAVFCILMIVLLTIPGLRESSLNENAWSVLLEQIGSAFLITSIIAVLSDRTTVILWDNIAHEKLVVPVGLNLVDLAVYVFTIIFWSAICMCCHSWILQIILAVLETVILVTMVFKVLSIYFTSDWTRRKMIRDYLDGDTKERLEKLNRLHNNILAKLGDKEYEGLCADLKDLLVGYDVLSAEQDIEIGLFRGMIHTLILKTAQECPFVFGTVIRENWSLDEWGLDEGKDKCRILKPYTDHLSGYQDAFNQVARCSGGEIARGDLLEIAISAKNMNPPGQTVFKDDPFLTTGAQKRYLMKYAFSPNLIRKGIEQIDEVLQQEREAREGQENQDLITFRNSMQHQPLADKEIWNEWMDILQQYQDQYEHTYADEKKELQSCIKGITWLSWIYYGRESRSLKSFEESVMEHPGNLEGLCVNPKKDKKLAKILLWCEDHFVDPDHDVYDVMEEVIDPEELQKAMEEVMEYNSQHEEELQQALIESYKMREDLEKEMKRKK